MAVRLKVRELAEIRGLNITTLSRKAEISPSQAWRIWHNKVSQLEFKTLDRLARALEVSVGELWIDDGTDVVESEGKKKPVLMSQPRNSSTREPNNQRKAA
jgi:DNA-binding Xre family transcriptional regulator